MLWLAQTLSSSQPVSGSLSHPPAQHDLVVGYPGPLGHDKMLLTAILICQEGLNYPIWRRALERMWKKYTGVGCSCFSPETGNHLPGSLHTFHIHVIPMSLMSVFRFEASYQVCQFPCTSARGERGFPLISTIWCGNRTWTICLFPMLQTGAFGNAAFLLTLPKDHFKEPCEVIWKCLVGLHCHEQHASADAPTCVVTRKPRTRCWCHLDSRKSNSIFNLCVFWYSVWAV